MARAQLRDKMQAHAMMEVATLLEGTLNADGEVRKSAEQRLLGMEQAPEYHSAFFLLLGEASVPLQIKQAAAVYFKNMVARQWAPEQLSKKAVGMQENDKALIRENLLEMMVVSAPRVRSQLAEALKTIVTSDLPARYPGLIPSFVASLQTNEPNRLDAVLLALRHVVKVYEFRNDSSTDGRGSRKTLDEIIDTLFPLLIQVLKPIQQQIETQMQAGDLVGCEPSILREKLVFKIFWSCTSFKLPAFVMRHPDHFDAWMCALMAAWKRPVPSSLMQDKDDDELLRMPEWKVKKWIGHIIHRFFQRYGDPKRLQDDESPDLCGFAESFLNSYAPHLTAAVVEVLAWPHTQHTRLSPRVANLALNFIEASVAPARTYLVLQPQIGPLLSKIIFPYLCMSAADLELWENDPIEYVRKSTDILEDFYSPRSAACSVLYTLSQLRAQKTILPFLNDLTQILFAYEQTKAAALAAPNGVTPGATEQGAKPDANGNPSSATSSAVMMQNADLRRLACQKDGVFTVVGNIKEKLLSNAKLTEAFKNMLIQYVIPEMQSEFGFLRARACWVMGQIALTDFDFFMTVPDLLMGVLDAILRQLQDPDFPVRVQAATELRHFLSNPSAASAVLPVLPNVLTQVCALIDEVDNTDIVTTIETIVERFSEHIVPYALPLCSKLTLAFIRASNAGEEEEESSLAAIQCVQALEAIIQSLAEKHEDPGERAAIMQSIERQILPVFRGMFEEERMDFFDDLLSLLSLLVYFSGCKEQNVGLSAEMWALYCGMIDSFNDWAFDFASTFVAPVDNFISNGTEQFLTGASPNGVPYVKMAFDMVMKLWEHPEMEDDAEEGCKIVEVMVLNCRGRINDVIVALLHAIVSRLRSAESPRLKMLLLSNFAACIYYDPVLTLSVIEGELKIADQVFGLWLSMLDSFERVHDKKLTLLALSTLLALPPAHAPPFLNHARSRVLHYCIVLVERIREQREERNAELTQPAFASAQAGGGRAALRSSNESERDFDDYEDADLNKVDLDYVQRIAEEAGVDLNRLAAIDNLDDDEDDYYDDELDDEGDFDSPIDDVDEELYLRQCFRSIRAEDQQILADALDAGQKAWLHQILSDG
ncbi:Importin beta-like SAD2 [Porphyridium purpureum]|uniref:Importin beta-like SAD2 n=1 Tax=Porphyridium purpureum TaxID=35688 RepID=A0A5J4YXL0_PORPP|nr:Importin beta-like SAD2 [Porphyridium purpureum]|eukprot:POR1943..scf209_3